MYLKVQVTVTTFIVRTSKTTAHNENIQDKASLAGYTIVSGKFKLFYLRVAAL